MSNITQNQGCVGMGQSEIGPEIKCESPGNPENSPEQVSTMQTADQTPIEQVGGEYYCGGVAGWMDHPLKGLQITLYPIR